MFEGTIRIGYRDCKVEAWPTDDAIESGAFADYDAAQQLIRVRTDLPPQLTAECLLHEVIHAAYDVGCLDVADSEERVVSVLGAQLSQVIRDNPDLIAYLQYALALSPL